MPKRYVNVVVTIETMMEIPQGIPTVEQIKQHLGCKFWVHVYNDAKVVNETTE